QKQITQAATDLYDAMKGGLTGAGKNAEKVYATLEGKSKEEIDAIRATYADHYKGRNLDEDIKGEFRGKTGNDRVTALLNGDTAAANAAAIWQSIGYVHSDHGAILRAIERTPPDQRGKLVEAFKKYSPSLDEKLSKNLSTEELARARALLAGHAT